MSPQQYHVILAILHGTSGLVSLGCTTFVLQMQNLLTNQPNLGTFHVHMYPDEASLMNDITNLVSNTTNNFHIPPTVPLEHITVCVIPGEFAPDAKGFLDALHHPIPTGRVLAFPYPLPTYNLKGALTGDDVCPENAMVFNVPNDKGVFPEQPRLYMCSVPTFVGPESSRGYEICHPMRIVHTSPLAFVGCVGNRLGGRLR